MFVEDYPDDSCAVFVFDAPEYLSFYGRNTILDLDIIFVDSGIIDSVKSIRGMDCSPITSDGKCNMAIEVKAGWCSANNIQAGMEVYMSLDTVTFLS